MRYGVPVVLVVLAGCDRVLGLNPIAVKDARLPSDASVPALVQAVPNVTPQVANLFTFTMATTPISGDVLVMIGGAENGASNVTSTGVSLTEAVMSNASSTDYIWYGVADGSPVNVSFTTMGSACQLWAEMTEWSGLAATSPYDAGSAAGALVGSAGSGQIVLQATTTGAPDLLVFGIASYGVIGSPDVTWSPIEPFKAGPVTQGVWYRVATAAGAQAATATYQTDWDAVLGAFHVVP